MRILLLLSFCALYLSSAADSPKAPKNVILMIGDGMGPQQLGLLFSYAKLAPNSIYKSKELAFEELLQQGSTALSMTNPADKIVVDSACSATQLAIGEASGSEMIGLNKDGHKVETVLELAEKLGKSTGLVSDTRITHATPASFASHQAHRSMENAIAEDIISQDIEVLLPGGLAHWIPQSVNTDKAEKEKIEALISQSYKIRSKRKDDKNLLDKAKENAYALAFNKEDLLKSSSDKILGLFSNSGMANGIKNTQWKNSKLRTEPRLDEMASKALEVLSKNDKGFFLMIEAGQIDWAGHNNDTGTLLHEMIRFDDTLKVVLDFVKNRDDTILLVTADHETGGFGFSYSRFNIPTGKSLPGAAFKDRLFKPNYNFAKQEILDQIYQQKLDYPQIISQFKKLKKEERNAKNLQKIINQNTAFTISLGDAQAILDNKGRAQHFKHEDHKYCQVAHFEDFFGYGGEDLCKYIALALSKYQSTVWATRTHTSTPVTATAFGKSPFIDKFKGLKSHPEIGQIIKNWVLEKDF